MSTYLNRPVFDFAIDWSSQPATPFSYDLRQTVLGFAAPQFEQLQQWTARGFRFSMRLDSEQEIISFDDWSAQLLGRLNGFWIASPFEQFQIVAGIDASSFLIVGQDLREAISEEAGWHVIFTKDGETSQMAEISGVFDNLDGREKVILTAPLATPVDETWTASKLLYARLAKDEESAEMGADTRQVRNISLIELPTEYAQIETGQQPVYLYEFWTETDAGNYYWRLTSLNENILSNGNAFASHPITHAGLQKSMRSNQDGLEIDGWYRSDNPLSLFVPFSLPKPLWVNVWETTYAAPDTRSLLFFGRIDSVEQTGKAIRAQALSILDVLGRQFPRMLIQPRCNYLVYQTPCGVDKTQFQATVTLSQISDRHVIITPNGAQSPDRFTGAVKDYFALGWIQTGSGQHFEIRSILQSSAEYSSQIMIELNLPLRFAIAGQSATMYAGCDGSGDTCDTKFNNWQRWGGHVVPPTNPTVKAMQAQQSANKK